MDITVRQIEWYDLNNQDFWDCLRALTVAPTLLMPDAAMIHLRRETYWTLVAELGERLVGTLTLIIEPKFTHGGSLVGHIEDVAVHPDFQKQGVGSKLLIRAIALAKEAKCYKLILDCAEEVAPFYEKHDFRRHNLGLRLDVK